MVRGRQRLRSLGLLRLPNQGACLSPPSHHPAGHDSSHSRVQPRRRRGNTRPSQSPCTYEDDPHKAPAPNEGHRRAFLITWTPQESCSPDSPLLGGPEGLAENRKRRHLRDAWSQPAAPQGVGETLTYRRGARGELWDASRDSPRRRGWSVGCVSEPGRPGDRREAGGGRPSPAGIPHLCLTHTTSRQGGEARGRGRTRRAVLVAMNVRPSSVTTWARLRRARHHLASIQVFFLSSPNDSDLSQY